MKQLTCEMCGSTDLMKQDGAFVCQGCGCKYSVEEAKRMMAEDGDAVAPVAPAAPANNSAQIDNLLNLAQSSYDSKNYAQAEAFCNQIIALDSLHYQAWKLKGQAINFQIGANNQRILEAYNCIMTAYKVLPDDQKAAKVPELLADLKEFMVGEMYFWLNQFEAGRPKNSALIRTKNAYTDAYNKLAAAFDEFGLPEEEKWAYLRHFDNLFIAKANTIVTSAWNSTVGYNYYRDYLDSSKKSTDPFARSDQRWIIKDTDLYRPMKNTWDTFLEEADNLINLSQFAEEQFNDETPIDSVVAVYNNIVYIEERIIPSGSWHITQGYTSNWDEYKSVGWHEEYNLTDAAKSIRRKTVSKYKALANSAPKEAEARRRAKEEKEKQERVAKYWSAHPEEKAQLEQQLDELTKQLEAVQTQISELEKKNGPKISALKKKRNEKLPSEVDVEAQHKLIGELLMDKSRMGLFKFKQKKALQERIDNEETPKLKQLQDKAAADKKAHQAKIDAQIKEVQAEGDDLREEAKKLQKKIDKVNKELTKDRPED